MSSSPSSTSVSTEERRHTILRAAYRVMAREGVHRTPLDRVAAEAGVSKGLLLYHFHSKDELALAAMEWVLDATAARVRKALADTTSPADAISAVIDAVWITPEANRDFFRFYLDGVEHQTRSPGFEDLGTTAAAIINGLYQDVIEAGLNEGVFDAADPVAAAVDMRAIIEGSFLQWLQTDDWRTNHAKFRERCRAAVLTQLRATP
jgi:TetR/AcrR family transcriptional regulator, fatty acid metabolism regulator protein